MHGEYDRAMAPRIFMTAIHAAAVAATDWLLLGGGADLLSAGMCHDLLYAEAQDGLG